MQTCCEYEGRTGIFNWPLTVILCLGGSVSMIVMIICVTNPGKYTTPLVEPTGFIGALLSLFALMLTLGICYNRKLYS